MEQLEDKQDASAARRVQAEQQADAYEFEERPSVLQSALAIANANGRQLTAGGCCNLSTYERVVEFTD